MAFALSVPDMHCFFGTIDLPSNNQYGKSAIVTFHIPDVGIRFKAPFEGVDKNHSDFASLLALLEFIDSNQKYFTNRDFTIYGNNRNVIEQVNGLKPLPDEFAPLMQKANQYRQKYHFKLDWVSSDKNSAFGSLFD